MPGQLRPDSLCPMCKTPLIFIVDTSRYIEDNKIPQTVREYHHEKFSGISRSVRRRWYCKRTFTGHLAVETAKRERWALESPPIGSRPN